MLPSHPLVEISTDLLWTILTFCDIEDLRTLRLVNKYLKKNSEKITSYICKYVTSHYDLTIPENILLKFSELNLLDYLTTQRILLAGGGTMNEGPQSYMRNDIFSFKNMNWRQCPDSNYTHGMIKTEMHSTFDGAYLVAGEENPEFFVEYFSIYSNKWTSLPSLPTNVIYCGSTYFESKLFVIGGIEKSGLSISPLIYSYNSNTNEWNEEHFSLEVSRYGHSCAHFNKSIYIIGGKTNEGITANVEILKSGTNETIPGPLLNVKRLWSRAVIVNKELYVVGGDVDDKEIEQLSTIEKLNVLENKWELFASFKQKRRFYSVTSLHDHICIIGGKDECYSSLTSVDLLNTRTKLWSTLSSLQLPREKFNCGQAVTIPSEEITWTQI